MRFPFSSIVPALAMIAVPAARLEAQSARRAELVPFAGFMVMDDLLRGPLGTTMSNSNGLILGGQIGLPVAGPVSVYASGAFTRSDLTIGVPILGGLAVGRTNAWLGDAGVELRVPTTGSAVPVLQAGGGLVRYDISNQLLGTHSTSRVVALGAGVDIRLVPAVGLRLMAKDYIGRFDFQEAALVDVEGRTAHHTALLAGLRIGM